MIVIFYNTFIYTIIIKYNIIINSLCTLLLGTLYVEPDEHMIWSTTTTKSTGEFSEGGHLAISSFATEPPPIP